MFKMPKQEFTPEFRELAVKRVKSGMTIGAVAKELGLVEQTLRNWVKAAEKGKLNPPGAKVVTPEQMERLKEYGMICSMSRNGNCWDNAPTESFFNSYKNERVHGTRYESRAEAIADAFDYIEPFYNRRRRHSTLGYASPQQFLNDWIKRQHERKLAA